MRFNNLLRFFILFCISIAGCTNTSNTSPVISVPTRTSISITETPIPPTQTITPTSTPTIIPTLSVDDARKRLLELLATNGDCRLPCLWGISPGKSSYQEARNILMPLSSAADTVLFDSSYPGDGISLVYAEGDLNFNTSVSYLYEKDGTLSRIIFKVFEEKVEKDPIDPSGKSWLSKTPIFDSATFGKRVEYYSLSHVLSEQGIPDSVMIYIPRGEDYPIVAGILEAALLYPEQGIWIKYAMSMYNNGNIIKGCPANAHIEMQLYPSGNPESFFSLLEKTDWGRTKGGYKPLEEATSMSVEQFYETFQNPTDKCIETQTNLWTTPQPGGG